MNEKLNWGILSDHRDKLMGLAAILVVILHFTADLTYSGLPDPIPLTARRLYACAVPLGVAMFLFLSGMGLYFSMRKGTSLRVFYRNRYLNLLITYGLWGLVFWSIADFYIRGSGLKRFLVDYSLYSFWRYGDHSFWYVAAVTIFFLIFPLLYILLRPENRLRKVFFVLILGLTAYYALWLKDAHPYYYSYIEIYVLRFPAFLLGIWFGAKVYDRAPFSKWDIVLLTGTALARLAAVIDYAVYHRGMWVYQRVLCDCASLVFMVLAAIFFAKVDCRRLSGFLKRVSGYTLELYLTHLSMWNLLGHYKLNGPQFFLPMLALAVVLSILLHRLTILIRNLYMKTAVPLGDRFFALFRH